MLLVSLLQWYIPKKVFLFERHVAGRGGFKRLIINPAALHNKQQFNRRQAQGMADNGHNGYLVVKQKINTEPVRYSTPMSLEWADLDPLAVGSSIFKLACDCAFPYLLPDWNHISSPDSKPCVHTWLFPTWPVCKVLSWGISLLNKVEEHMNAFWIVLSSPWIQKKNIQYMIILNKISQWCKLFLFWSF